MIKQNRYEVLMLTVPEITQDEIKELEKQLDRVVQEGKGSVISFERWGKYRLAYPVRKNEYGVYFLMRFQAQPNALLMSELRSLFAIRFDALVMRDTISLLHKDVTLEYQRPRSLEEAPAREEGFVRDNRSRDRDVDHESRDVNRNEIEREEIGNNTEIEE